MLVSAMVATRRGLEVLSDVQDVLRRDNMSTVSADHLEDEGSDCILFLLPHFPLPT